MFNDFSKVIKSCVQYVGVGMEGLDGLFIVGRLTYNSNVRVLDQGRVGRHLALVQPLVTSLRELNLQLPVVRFFVDNLEASIAAVGLPAVGQQMWILVLTDPLQPRYLQRTMRC